MAAGPEAPEQPEAPVPQLTGGLPSATKQRRYTGSEEPPPPVYGAVTPYDQPLPVHGGYLVTYPERLGGGVGGRGGSTVPTVWPVVLYTLLFGFWAVISVRRRTARARAAGGRTAPYWRTFWGVQAAVLTVSVASGVLVGYPAFLQARETNAVEVLQENLIGDGRLATTAKLKATSARCTAEGERGDDGIRPYLCVLSLTDKRSGKLHVTADIDGAWALAPTR